MKRLISDQWLGLFVLAFAILLLFVWIPLDIETGLVEKVRRRVLIGDALAPTVAGIVIALGATLTWLKPDTHAPKLTAANLKWIGALLIVFGLSLTVMRYLGPALGSLLVDEGYRPLRNTIPWKYLGYIVGGTIMVAGLSGLSQKRSTSRLVLIGVAAATAIALAYDLPFDDLLLPPNGDV